jgi:RecA/RadA recombinase
MQFPLSKISEFFKPIDITEGIYSIWGDFGVGKTTYSLQTAKLHALNKKRILFIYTKPNIPYDRISFVFENALEAVLETIVFQKLTNFEEMYKYIFNLEFSVLEDLKSKRRGINLIVIDSMTDLYRLELNREKKGKNFILNFKLNQLLANLVYLNKKYQIELLVVNEISRRTQDGQTYEVESGGNVMDYWVKNSIKIERTDVVNERKFVLHRGNDNSSFIINYKLSDRGFE